MKVTINIDGMERIFQGSYDELHCRDWNKKVRDFIDDVQDYNKNEVPLEKWPFVEQISKETQDALDKLTIRT